MTEKTRILFLASNPRKLEKLRLDEEARDIQARVRAAEFRDQFEFITKWAVRTGDLLEIINEVRPHVVHFSGHGADAELAFEDAAGYAKSVGEAALAGLMRAAAESARLVVLNACRSGQLARSVVRQVDCAVGMSETVSNPAAVAFAASFYGALAFGRSVGQAFDQGRTALLLGGIPEEDTPELFARDGVDALAVHLVDRPQARPVLPPLAVEILRAAVAEQSQIRYVRHDGGFNVGTGTRLFVGDGMERAAAHEDALLALSRAGLVNDIGAGEYRVTGEGYKAGRAAEAPNAGFSEVCAAAPALIREMKHDLAGEGNGLIREFFVLKKKSHQLGGSSKPRLIYYEEDHANLRGALDVLENNGHLIDVTTGNVPIYRMTEGFVRLVRATE